LNPEISPRSLTRPKLSSTVRLSAKASSETVYSTRFVAVCAIRSAIGIHNASAIQARPLGHKRSMDKVNVLLIGSGGRGQTLRWKLAQSPLLDRLYCAPGNAGIAEVAEGIALDIAHHAAGVGVCHGGGLGPV